MLIIDISKIGNIKTMKFNRKLIVTLFHNLSFISVFFKRRLG